MKKFKTFFLVSLLIGTFISSSLPAIASTPESRTADATNIPHIQQENIKNISTDLNKLATKKSDDESSYDVSISGQIAYACALVKHIQTTYGPVKTWREQGVGGIGNGARAMIEASAAASLLGAYVGANHRIGHDGNLTKYARDIITGIQSLNFDRIQSGLNGLAAGCTNS